MGEADLMRSRDLGQKFECKSTSGEGFQFYIKAASRFE